MFPHATRSHFCIFIALLLTACSREQARLDATAKALVERHASQADAEATIGHAVSYILTRDEAAGYYAKTRPDDLSVRQTWERLMAHPETISFSMTDDGSLVTISLHSDQQRPTSTQAMAGTSR